tara:strand:- start:516 stop:1127 length:612 start_codon:yes stop_codon:yes gene_type:complete
MAIGKEVFSQILARSEGVRRAQGLSTRSLTWFRKQVDKAVRGEKISSKSIMSQRDSIVSKIFLGRMYHFRYDAKWKEKLPYWDMFPLVIPIDFYNDGFSGLNLHYLPPRLRARLFDALTNVLSDDGLNERAKFKLTYQMLSGVKMYRLYKPTFKRYLYKQIRTRFLQISPSEWQIALFLPTQKFQKARPNAVWSDSRKIARGR